MRLYNVQRHCYVHTYYMTCFYDTVVFICFSKINSCKRIHQLTHKEYVEKATAEDYKDGLQKQQIVMDYDMEMWEKCSEIYKGGGLLIGVNREGSLGCLYINKLFVGTVSPFQSFFIVVGDCFLRGRVTYATIAHGYYLPCSRNNAVEGRYDMYSHQAYKSIPNYLTNIYYRFFAPLSFGTA